MSKGAIFGILAFVFVAIIIIVIVVKSKGSSAAQDDPTSQAIADALKDTPKCSKQCRELCKKYPLISFKGTSRAKCQKRCVSMCGQGIDVTNAKLGS